jgi:HAMP domain-containing protein
MARPRLAVAALGLMTLVGGAVLALSLARAHPSEELPTVLQTVALGDSAPRVPQATTQPAPSKGLGLDMPQRPFKGQVLPPCKGVETEIELTPGRKDTRSCWIKVDAAAEKCQVNGYEYKGSCYLPSHPSQQLPQSIGP